MERDSEFPKLDVRWHHARVQFTLSPRALFLFFASSVPPSSPQPAAPSNPPPNSLGVFRPSGRPSDRQAFRQAEVLSRLSSVLPLTRSVTHSLALSPTPSLLLSLDTTLRCRCWCRHCRRRRGRENEDESDEEQRRGGERKACCRDSPTRDQRTWFKTSDVIGRLALSEKRH